ncbi:phosphoribosylformylglycinamidine synthase II [Alicyclobacillus hesperidum URH17-3-68]|uniref:Phosphoribosylformylglycinamidine synthase subunit PurL n=1 Tax=Alicyclobacillus hesperidum TaxID=89784 RepID=A0A1H2UIE7_9BACL|nr:phosphoribosylformylglycinamidine synthase subunit PurL [Alicyclobacillus hesperidum]EJY54887.1 phosphoribosylformylglycinamidine synthase II [Alicyclobacillus hesperidum URH17-3-68]GLV14413.1 phosphoribosylformylglycinamidine synthase subunit PurL [Alicyclobacillus hesperidum]SDW55933.1 phosphoribosylformylglycinamidine synthase [Alicyclobacillus hesperidum]
MREPTPEQIRDERVYRSLGLTDAEYDLVVEKLGRLPNYVEAGIFGVLWSEHCSYKSSKVHLRRFPTSGSQVLQGPGENAGVVDIGDGMAVAFKMESHNHPSAVEPYQGAATGVGGILRDIFTMGARPVAFLDSLRFGPLDDARTRYLFSEVVAGIGGYGNCVGIPTVGGEVQFSPTYRGNPLVNAMCVGILPADGIVRGTATGVGNPVFVVGARTGRDGIHGATFASAEDPEEKERSAVQVGDPFLGKLLMEACLELIASGVVVGIQDMGAAGLTSSSAEMASRAGGGLELVLDRVPVREEGMTPYEMMLSESQERMLVVLERGREQVAFDIFRRYGLEVADVGRVTDDGRLRLIWHGEVVGDMPVAALVDEAPVYERPIGTPRVPEKGDIPTTLSVREAWLAILAHPSVADKRWVYRQYDTMVRAQTVMGPGSDAALVKVPGMDKAIAMATDGNSRYVALNPRRGGQIAVAEAVRNLATTGAKPLAITNCLNFGNPEKPEVMRQLSDAIDGMADACKALDTPVVSGNVSLYNESRGLDIQPTPVVGAVGVIDGIAKRLPSAPAREVAAAGLELWLLGREDDRLDGTLYGELVCGQPVGDAPYIDLAEERRLHELLQAIAGAQVAVAAHDVTEGGIAAAAAEMMIQCDVGGELHAPVEMALLGWLFSEAQGRALVAVAQDCAAELARLADTHAVPARKLGWLGATDDVIVRQAGDTAFTISLAALRDAFERAIPMALQSGAAEASA